MKILNNNKGMSLVEIVVGIVLLSIAGIMLVQSFASTARIANRATLYKNASSTAAASVELEEAQTPAHTNYESGFNHASPSGSGLVIRYSKDGTNGTFTMNGQYAVGTADSEQNNAKLTYREFLPSNFSFEVPAEVEGS